MHDNIFESDCDAIVNTVNCVGVMGGGLAKQFRLRYPEMNLAYQHACARGEVITGKMWEWYNYPLRKWIINFPTKDDWRNPSKIEYVNDGLQDLRRVIDDLNLPSIAIPALGCGLGGLKWVDVEALIAKWLAPGAILIKGGVRVDIYPPTGRKYTL